MHIFLTVCLRRGFRIGLLYGASYASPGLDTTVLPIVRARLFMDAEDFIRLPTFPIDSLLGERGWRYASLSRTFEAVCQFD
jgi:hypothetical protein